jgi:hypothetical protein
VTPSPPPPPRYDKTALSYAGFFSLAASLVALSRWDP